MDNLGTQLSLVVRNPRSSTSSTHDPNFSEAQDLLLCSAWSNATNDAIVGTDQNGNAFWVKAHAYWLSHKKETFLERVPDSLMQRFSRIRTSVSKFCGYLAQVELLSGYSEIDKIAMATEMYAEFETKKNAGKKKPSRSLVFAFEHCWKVLINDQKWLQVTSVRKSTSTEPPFNTSSPAHINLEDEELSTTPKMVGRPVGRKLAKEGRTKRKGKVVYDNLAILKKIDQSLASNEKHHNDDVSMFSESDKKIDVYLEIEKENLALTKRKFDMEEKKFDMDRQIFNVEIALKEAEFMKIDISSLTNPNEIEFYQAMKMNIKAKYQRNE